MCRELASLGVVWIPQEFNWKKILHGQLVYEKLDRVLLREDCTQLFSSYMLEKWKIITAEGTRRRPISWYEPLTWKLNSPDWGANRYGEEAPQGLTQLASHSCTRERSFAVWQIVCPGSREEKREFCFLCVVQSYSRILFIVDWSRENYQPSHKERREMGAENQERIM